MNGCKHLKVLRDMNKKHKKEVIIKAKNQEVRRKGDQKLHICQVFVPPQRKE